MRFEDGTEGVWKKETGWPASASSEMAAYKLDQELGTDFVGTTVERTFNGVPGTVQVRVTNLKKKSLEDNPDELSLFDYLIGNRDRHYNNYLQNESGQLVAIDHGLAFSSVDTTNGLFFFDNKVKSLKTRIDKRVALERDLEKVKGTPNSAAAAEDLKQQITKLKLQESQLQSAIAIAIPDKKVIDKLRQIKLARWKELLGGDLNEKQILALYKRQRELLRSIDRAVEDIGPQVLYREGPISPMRSAQPAQSGYPFGNIQLFGRPKK
ncbi:Phosphatidylinositol 3- and 4-kinase [compost metagenome]